MTAVEWLLNHFDEIYHIKDKFLPSDWEFLEETSKEMEKKQIMNTFADGFVEGVETQKSGEQLLFPEQYYNETYKKE